MSWSWAGERDYWAWELPKLWRVGKWVLLAIFLLSFVGMVPGVAQVINALIVAIPVVAIARRIIAARRFDEIAHQRWQARTSKWIRNSWPALARNLRLEVRDMAGNPVLAGVGRPVWAGGVCSVPVALPPGLVREDLVAAAGHIAQAFGASRVSVIGESITALSLRVEYLDALAQPFSLPLGGSWDGKSVLMGVADGGGEWRMPIGPHTLVAGSSGSGKHPSFGGFCSGWRSRSIWGSSRCGGSTARAGWNWRWGVTC